MSVARFPAAVLMALAFLIAPMSGQSKIQPIQFSDTRLANGKRALVASFALSTENPRTALSYATTITEYGLPADYWDTYPEKIAAVTAADVQRVARQYIPLENIVIVAVGDVAKIRPVLAEFGKIENWDSEGRRVQ